LKLRNLAIAGLLFAGPLQASILYLQSSGLGLGPGSNSIFQDFSSPSSATAQQAQIASSGATGTGTLFSNLTLVSDTNLYYDPNGASGCGVGKGTAGSPSLPNLTACVGNYSLSGTPAGSNQTTIQSSLAPAVVSQPTLDVVFNAPVYATSFLFAAPSAGPNTLTFEVDIYDASNNLLDTQQFKATLTTPAYLIITENKSFKYVDITKLIDSGAQSTIGTTGEGTFTGAATFNALIGDLQATTVAPEPGTIGLIGFGLAGLGYLARRRKA
jgi:hypothetical protein